MRVLTYTCDACGVQTNDPDHMATWWEVGANGPPKEGATSRWNLGLMPETQKQACSVACAIKLAPGLEDKIREWDAKP